MAQVPGLGLDQSQLADVINQQYKGYSQKQRNQMMQSAAATPDNWGAITQQSNKTATQPTEFLGAGRTDNIPSVSLNDQQLGFLPKDSYEQQVSSDPYLQSTNLAPTYSNTSGYYFKPETAKTYSNALSMQDWIKKSNLSIGSSTPVTTLSDFFKSFGSTPTGGWSDANTKFSSDNASLQRWMSDSSFLPQFSLYGSGTPADIQQGFNILQRMSPQNIGEFWGLSPETKKGMLENPANALQFMRATANPANRDWLSIGAEGGYSGIDSYQFDPKKGMTVDPSRYLQIDDSNSGLLGSLNEVIQKVDPLNFIVEKGVANLLGYDSGLDMVRSIGEPIGNLAGAIWSGGIPWGSIVAGADNLSTGNDQAILGNVINGLASYAGSNVGSGGVMGTDVSLGSAAANSAANNMIINAGANYARTGDLENALKAAAFSTAAGSAGNWLGSATSGSLGEIASKALGGAASGGLNSLFSKNSPVAGSLFGAMSGGLHGFLNSTDRSNNTYNKQQDTKNRQTAQAATKLAKLFTKK